MDDTANPTTDLRPQAAHQRTALIAATVGAMPLPVTATFPVCRGCLPASTLQVMVVDPVRLQAEIAALHHLEREALLCGDVTAARDVAVQKFEVIAILDEITRSN